MIEARKINRGNLDALLDLEVRDDQKQLVASNAVTIAQAHYEPAAWLRGLWAGDRAVGLLAMVDFGPEHPAIRSGDPQNAAYLWRLMIDAAQQRKGYGRGAIELAFRQARDWGRDALCLHVAEQDGNALPFYKRFGFAPTDRVDNGERFMVASLSVT